MSTAMALTNGISNSSEEEFELRRGPWTLEEDTLLIHYITCHGEGRWNLLAKCAGLKRTGKSCRLRWLNYLKPDIKRGNLSPHEQLSILELHSMWGNRWSKIAQHLPGRTDNEIKNYWRTRVQKQARQLKIDSNSKRFLEALRNFWKPRLLEKMEQSSSSSSFSCTSTMENQDPSPPPLETKQAPLALSSPQPRKLNNFHHLDDKSSSSISSIDSLTISQLPENSAQPKSPAYAYGKNSSVNDCYYVDIGNFDMEDFNQGDTSAVASHISISECQMAEIGWINDDVGDTYWKMDELW